MNNKAIFSISSLAVILIDQLTKMLVRLNLNRTESIPVIKNIFHITYITNTGSAFGIFKGLNIVFIIISIIVIFAIVYSIKNINEKSKIEFVLFALLLGGVIGNLIDRIFFGNVTDFMDFRIWPVFNVADSMITISAIALAYYYWKRDNN